MSAVYCGSLSLGGAMPGAGAAVTAGADGVNAAFPDIAARVAALEAQLLALASMPPLPSFADMLARAVQLQTSITLAMSTPGLPAPPSLLSAIAALQALLDSLLALSADLNVKLTLIVDIKTRLEAAGVHVVAFDGDLSTLGSDLQGAVNAHVAGSGHANAVALVTTLSGTWADMSAVLKVTP